jgi:hypothetical protein
MFIAPILPIQNNSARSDIVMLLRAETKTKLLAGSINISLLTERRTLNLSRRTSLN